MKAGEELKLLTVYNSLGMMDWVSNRYFRKYNIVCLKKKDFKLNAIVTEAISSISGTNNGTTIGIPISKFQTWEPEELNVGRKYTFIWKVNGCILRHFETWTKWRRKE